MTLSVAEFRLEFPEFADTSAYSNDYVQRKLDQAARRMDASFFGDVADDAQGYMTAHLITINPPTGSAGGRVVSSVTAGSASVTYESSHTAGRGLESTGYGRNYLELRDGSDVFMGSLCG